MAYKIIHQIKSFSDNHEYINGKHQWQSAEILANEWLKGFVQDSEVKVIDIIPVSENSEGSIITTIFIHYTEYRVNE